jgi:hypothetical protein
VVHLQLYAKNLQVLQLQVQLWFRWLVSSLFSCFLGFFLRMSFHFLPSNSHLSLYLLDTAAHKMAFSSYPGFLESLDDFYMMSSSLVMLQTTNSIFNLSLYEVGRQTRPSLLTVFFFSLVPFNPHLSLFILKAVTPDSLLAWHRVRVANMMAKSGSEWANAVSQYNSGTYNNQYMVIDTKEFVVGQPLGANVLWVVEQIPGLMER